jgi:hypothetical protein
VPNTARIGPMSNPANVSEVRSSYRPPIAGQEPMTFELESARMLGYQWGALMPRTGAVSE